MNIPSHLKRVRINSEPNERRINPAREAKIGISYTSTPRIPKSILKKSSDVLDSSDDHEDNNSSDSLEVNNSYWEDNLSSYNSLKQFQKTFLEHSGFIDPNLREYLETTLTPNITSDSDLLSRLNAKLSDCKTMDAESMCKVLSLLKSVPIFDVHSSRHSLEEFLDKSKLIYNSLPNSTQSFFLKNISNRLSEDVKETIRGMKFSSITELEEILKKLFTKRDIRNILVSDLYTCKQLVDETLNEYQNKILRLFYNVQELMREDYSDTESVILIKELETQTCNAFRLGIRDPDLRHKVQNSSKTKLIDLINVARDARLIENYSKNLRSEDHIPTKLKQENKIMVAQTDPLLLSTLHELTAKLTQLTQVSEPTLVKKD